MNKRHELAVFGGDPAVVESQGQAQKSLAPWPRISEDDASYLADVLRNTHPIIGSDQSEIVQLEEEWRKWIDVPFCRAVGSGTAGLHMALWAAGVGPGTEVLVPAYSFSASAMAVLHAGAAPVFVDVQRNSFNINPERIEAQISPRTQAILVVHLNGLPAEMGPIMDIARRHGLAIVEDCAHAHDATLDGKKVGTFGDAASFSLNGAKNLPGGEAGLFTTSHPSYYERSNGLWMGVTLAAQRESEKYPLASLGYNYRCSLMAATLARLQLKHLERHNAMRQANCQRLSDQLRDIPGVIAPAVPADRTHVYHMYRVRLDPVDAGLDVSPRDFRAKVVAALGAEGVICRSWMNWTLPELKIFSETDAFERKYPWRRTWQADRVYQAQDYPEARAVVDETTVVNDAPTAASGEVIDAFAEGFRKVFSRLDDVIKIELNDDLVSGELASCAAIRKALKNR